MKKISSLLPTAAAIAAIGLSLSLMSPAAVAAPEDRSSELQEVQSWFDSYNVSRDVQASLQKVIENGKLIDSMKHGAKPVSTREVVNDGFDETITTFADGSISVTASQIPVEMPKFGFTPFASITGCKISNGSGYSTATGCTVKHSNGYLHLSFKAGYEIVNGANDRITSATSPSATGSFGNTSEKVLTKHRMKEASANMPAHVTLEAQWKATNNGSSYTGNLDLKVGQNAARASANY